MEIRKMVTITLYVRQQKRHRCIEQSFGWKGTLFKIMVGSNLDVHWQTNGWESHGTYTQWSITQLKKKNTFESVLMRWVKLETIIQSEVSQKEKHQYSIKYIYMEFRKMVTMSLYASQQKRHKSKEQTFGLCERRQGWDDLRE